MIDFEQIVANICLLGNSNYSLYASLCFIQVIHLWFSHAGKAQDLRIFLSERLFFRTLLHLFERKPEVNTCTDKTSRLKIRINMARSCCVLMCTWKKYKSKYFLSHKKPHLHEFWCKNGRAFHTAMFGYNHSKMYFLALCISKGNIDTYKPEDDALIKRNLQKSINIAKSSYVLWRWKLLFLHVHVGMRQTGAKLNVTLPSYERHKL